jgi:hypothetical protein
MEITLRSQWQHCTPIRSISENSSSLCKSETTRIMSNLTPSQWHTHIYECTVAMVRVRHASKQSESNKNQFEAAGENAAQKPCIISGAPSTPRNPQKPARSHTKLHPGRHRRSRRKPNISNHPLTPSQASSASLAQATNAPYCKNAPPPSPNSPQPPPHSHPPSQS